MLSVLSPTLVSGTRPNFLYPSDSALAPLDGRPPLPSPYALRLIAEHRWKVYTYELSDGLYFSLPDWYQTLTRRYEDYRLARYVFDNISGQYDQAGICHLPRQEYWGESKMHLFGNALNLYICALSLPYGHTHQPLVDLRHFLIYSALKAGQLPSPCSLGFPLAVEPEQSGKLFYSITDWIKGLVGRPPRGDWAEAVKQSGWLWGFTHRRQTYTDLEGLLWLAVNLRSTPQTTALNTLKRHIAQAACLMDALEGGAA